MSDVLVANPIEEEKVYTCPTANEMFKGLCPITACPANITHIRPEGAGCAYLRMKSGNNFDKFKFAYLFKMETRIAASTAKEGRLRIRQALFFTSIVDNYIQKPTKGVCPKCGVEKLSAGVCLNVMRCDRREKLATRLLKKFPFSLKAINFDKVKLYQFGSALGRITRGNQKMLEKTGSPLHELIGVKRSTLRKLQRLTKTVASNQGN